MNLHNSYHIFMFPFRWAVPSNSEDLFHNQTSLCTIEYNLHSSWERVSEQSSVGDEVTIYNEKNYFYEFVHPALYDSGEDSTLLRHYERKEPKGGGVKYVIQAKGCDWQKRYELKVEAMNLNLYSTGVGVLSFYLANDQYNDPEDILRINQYGRRMYPPYYGDIQYRREIAESIEIEGLNTGRFFEDFTKYSVGQSNTPSCIIKNLIKDIATNIDIKAVIDDRMYVVSWLRNSDLVSKFKNYEKFNESWLVKDEFWYRYVFVDGADAMCRELEMREKLITEASYRRWQDWGTMYGSSRYSLVMLTDATESIKYLYDYFETTYARMAELCLVERASVLRFSAEVTQLSNLVLTDKRLSQKISSLYQEYIRFVNQIHFREVSAQDQGIEMYNLLYEQINLKEHVEKLDKEIEELHNHLSIKEDRFSNQEMAVLTVLATISVPASLVIGIFGMNDYCKQQPDYSFPLWLMAATTAMSILLFFVLRRRRNK